MNDESRVLPDNYQYVTADNTGQEAVQAVAMAPPPSIPDYLQDTYWWAYLHPKSFWFFEREWVVNLILWGNMKKLTNLSFPEPLRRRGAALSVVFLDISKIGYGGSSDPQESFSRRAGRVL